MRRLLRIRRRLLLVGLALVALALCGTAAAAKITVVQDGSQLVVSAKSLQPATAYGLSCTETSAIPGHVINAGGSPATSSARGKVVLRIAVFNPGPYTCWIRPGDAEQDAPPVTLGNGKPALFAGAAT